MAKTAVGAPLVHTPGPGENRWLLDLPVHANPNFVVYRNDFLTAQDFDTTGRFNSLLAGTGTNAIVTDGYNGQLAITSQATTDNTGGYIGLNQENFRVGDGANATVANRKIWFSTVVQMSTPGDQDLFAGFSIAVATTPANVWIDATTNNKIGFEVLDGSAQILARSVAGGVATQTNTGISVVANTRVRLDVVAYAGSVANRVAEYYVNGNLVARHSTNIPASSVALTPGVAFLSGSATGTMSGIVNYMLVAAERA